MNKVISGYFDEAHRGLQRQHLEGQAPSSASNVQLPPLRSNGGTPIGQDGMATSGGSFDKGVMRSSSVGALEFSHEQLNNGVQAERYQQTMTNNAKLQRRLRQIQDQLTITSAKKDAFKAQAQRLEREFKKGREQSDAMSKELLDARREAGQCSKEAQESLAMMTEMRKSHIMEVRLLQRGLAARSGGSESKNKVNEVADLVDKVGRAVVQRDEAIRDKTKMQSQCTKAVTDCRNLADETAKLKRRNRELDASLKEAIRKGRFNVPKAEKRYDDDSDEEFTRDLAVFEKRFEILEEGPAGLDILASNLSKDKQELEKRIKKQQETMRMLNQSIEDWKSVNTDKDEQIKELNLKVEKMLQDQALLNEQIAQKRREIELQVEEEKSSLESRIQELQGEVDLAQSQALGLEKVSSRLTTELVKVHGQYGTLESGQPDEGKPVDSNAPGGGQQFPIKMDKYHAKTGEDLDLEVRQDSAGAVELCAAEVGDKDSEVVIPISDTLKAELDAIDPYGPEFFNRVGVSLGPPKQIVISSLVAKRHSKLSGLADGGQAEVELTVYKYDSKRYLLCGMQMDTQKILKDLLVIEDALTPELCSKIDATTDNGMLFDLLVAGVAFSEDGESLSFSAERALNFAE